MPCTFDSLFALGAAPVLAAVFGTPVELERPGSAPQTATAEVLLREYEVEDDAGMPQRLTFRDYLFDRAQYQVAGVAVEPQRGDVVREVLDGVTCEFTVLPAGKRPHAELADESGRQWVVHTKQTDAQA